ncbi:O-antigen ligase family protein [Aquimarina sp. MMG015]|uniref:O-antigen ligase family protein n=1 Tax=Aquimarina sp. MMG015 TaxID=2822689 RepID=UPI001B3A6BD1|nr:O-antigen ligase family protein [Aquimarina sp. MMG015]MBQ4801408.1 O-antigen ligase family protein [Aquimarina sp. MMG015]
MKLDRTNIYLILLLLIVLTLPITYNLNSLSVILLSMFFFIDSKENLYKKYEILRKHKVFWAMTLYFFIQVFGLIYTENLKEGLKEVQALIPFLVLPMVILSEKISSTQRKKILLIFKYWILLLLLFLSVYHYFYLGRPISSFANFGFTILEISPFYFSGFIYLAIITIVFELKRKSFKSIYLYIELGTFLAFITLLGMRIFIIIILVALVLFVLKTLKNLAIKKKIAILISIPLLLMLLFLITPSMGNKIKRFSRTIDFDLETIITKNKITYGRNTIEYRILKAYASFNIIKENLVLGVGTGDQLDLLYKEYEKLGFKAGIKEKYNSHNQYLTEGLKTGVLGSAIFCFMLFVILKKGIQQNDELLYFSTFIIIICLIESFLSRQHGIIFTAFFVAILFNHNENGKLLNSKNA